MAVGRGSQAMGERSLLWQREACIYIGAEAASAVTQESQLRWQLSAQVATVHTAEQAAPKTLQLSMAHAQRDAPMLAFPDSMH
eukprot:1150576-Pelagomonas_calceolata.AAC.1